MVFKIYEESCLKCTSLSLVPKYSDSAELRMGLRIFRINQVPDDSKVVNLLNTLWEILSEVPVPRQALKTSEDVVSSSRQAHTFDQEGPALPQSLGARAAISSHLKQFTLLSLRVFQD